MACFPPVRPWVVPGPSGLPPLAAPATSLERREDSPLLHFDATLSVLLLRLPRPPRPMSTMIRESRTSRKLLCPSACPDSEALFFSLPCSRKRRGTVALIPRSPALGFGYPLGEMVWLPDPWRPLSAPNAPGLRSSEPCSSRAIGKPSRVPLSALALSGKTRTTLPRRFSGLIPPGKPCPSLSRVFSSGRDRCSPELSGLSGSPSGGPRKRTSPSLPPPPALMNPQPYDKKFNGPQGLPDRRPGSLPMTGRRPVWPFGS